MPTVLIVDDSALDRQLASKILEQDEGLKIETADGGASALSRIELGGIDLVVTDLQMPMINGIQLVINLREDFPEIPVILMTGEGSELVAMEALTHGAVNYVPKTVMREWLPRTVYEALSAQKMERSHQDILDAASYSELHLTMRNSPAMIKAVLQSLEQTAAGILRCPKSDIVRLGIANKEALEHALNHNSEIEYEYRIEPDRCTVLLKTRLPGKTIFDPQELPESANHESFESAASRGYFLMRTHLDDVHIDDDGQEAKLIMLATESNEPVQN